jgi:hypothetical protein
MKSHIVLLHRLLAEAGNRCCTSTIRDSKRITERVEHEGLSFLTITLPQLGKDIQKCLDQGRVEPTDFAGFAKTGCLPKLFSGFTAQLFNRSTGVLLDTPSVDAIHSLFQICFLFSKVELPCSDTRLASAFKGYVECESQVRQSDAGRSSIDLELFSTTAMRVWGDVLTAVDKDIYCGDIIPRHGPGSTADKLMGNQKFVNRDWTLRLEEIFPSGEFLFSSWSHFCDHVDSVNLRDPGSEIPVKVISVPKTLKTPRIIAIEPTCMQYAQQGILRSLVSSIQRHDYLGTLVGFDDQTPNQRMALEGSLYGTLATLDLSEASDRVSNQLVRALVAKVPWFSKALDATRSRKADVPGYGEIRLAKYASMGSALCFPIEAMVFLTIVIIGIEKERNTPLNRKDIQSLCGSVRIFGDDIIIPVEYVRSVVESLQDFGLVVNSSKSFWTGKFRESCGKEYYDGHDVSIVKLRRLFPTQRKHVSEIISLVSFRNQLYKAGWWDTCKYLDNYIERLIPFPVVAETSPAIGRHSFLGYETQRECSKLQRPLVRAYVVSPRLPIDRLDDAGALLKCLLKLEESQVFHPLGSLSADSKHLERAGRPKTVNIKLGWVPPY